jgi:hypothetical protein
MKLATHLSFARHQQKRKVLGLFWKLEERRGEERKEGHTPLN